MKNTISPQVPLAVIVFLLSSISAQACTWFGFLSDEDKPFIGRTMEWPGDLHAEMAIFPRGHDFETHETQYGFVGFNHKGIVSDGMNEHGLAMSALWLSDSKFPAKEDGMLHVVEMVTYILGNTKTIGETLEVLKTKKAYTEPSEVTSGLDLTVHFAITDASGRSIVVEFIDEETKIYENKVGAMTNDPTYDKHLEIWSAYDPSKFSEETFEGFDYSPEGRFSRMAAFNATQAAVPNDEAAVNRAWSMVNTVDIPQGILYWRWVNDSPQFTSYAVVGDLKNRIYYFRTYENYDIRKIDLRKIDFDTVEHKSVTVFGRTNYREFSFD